MDETSVALARVARAREKVAEWDERVATEVVAAYRAGATLAQLAEVMGVRSIETPRQLLIDRGEELRGRGRRKVDGAQQ